MADPADSPDPSAGPIIEFVPETTDLPFTRNDLSILAIDDDPVQLRTLQSALEHLGYKVTTADNGQSALDLLNGGLQVDLILSDVMMPVMNGPMFLTAARKDPRFSKTPIVMMSSNDQYEIVFDCLSKGADDYMIKPLSQPVLKSIFANVWLKRRQVEAAAKAAQEASDGPALAARVDEMKRRFQTTVTTPLKSAADALSSLIQTGGVKPPYVPQFQALIEKLRHPDSARPTIAQAAVPAPVQDFFGAQFGVGPSARKVVPVPVSAARKKPAPAAPAVPHLQPLRLADQLRSFDFNVWSIGEALLPNVANDIIGETALHADFGGKIGEVEFFLRKALQGFRPNPFHNFRRAIGNLQFAFGILSRLKVTLAPAETDAVLLAALLHDIDHPGTNAMFQTRTSSQIALTYNDRSVLENNSAAVGWKVLQDSFTLLTDDPIVHQVRQLFLRCVLKTDYSRLNTFLAKVLAHDRIDWGDLKQRALALPLLVLMADLSFALRPWNVAEYWYGLMRDEQLQQGDMERRLGMVVAALMDRKQLRPQAVVVQTHFKVMVAPIFQAGAKVFPELEKELLTCLGRNMQIVEAMEAVETPFAPPAEPPK